MSERMTSICIPGVTSRLADWGRVPVTEVIKEYRAYAEELKRKADAILTASDEDFHIETYVGVYVKRKIEVVQEGRGKPNGEQS